MLTTILYCRQKVVRYTSIVYFDLSSYFYLDITTGISYSLFVRCFCLTSTEVVCLMVYSRMIACSIQRDSSEAAVAHAECIRASDMLQSTRLTTPTVTSAGAVVRHRYDRCIQHCVIRAHSTDDVFCGSSRATTASVVSNTAPRRRHLIVPLR